MSGAVRRAVATTSSGSAPVLSSSHLVEVKAALDAGAAPGAALAACDAPSLAAIGHRVRLGHGLGELAPTVATGDQSADFLVRALALTEATGGPAGPVVDHAANVLRSRRETARLITARTAQARGSILLLGGMVPLLFAALAAFNPDILGFYATAPGVLVGGLAGVLLLSGVWCLRALVRRAERAPLRSDPLAPPRARPRWGAAAAVAVPGLITGVLVGAPVLAAVLAAVAAGLAGRPRGSRRGRTSVTDPADGGAAETVELLSVACSAGLAPPQAVAAVAPVAPRRARPDLEAAARRLRGGFEVGAAFAGSALSPLARTLAAAHTWGTPAAPALDDLAAELHRDRRAAAETAAERLQLTLVLPTALLVLPAFVVGVVPPLVWSILESTSFAL